MVILSLQLTDLNFAHMQLTNDTVETTMSEISQIIHKSEENEFDQTELSSSRISEALANVSGFIRTQQEPITLTVSNKVLMNSKS